MAVEWPTARLVQVAAINPDAVGRDWPHPYMNYLDISSVGVGQMDMPPQRLSVAEAPSRAKRLVQKGDTVISTVRPNRRSMFFASNPSEDWVVSTGFAVLRPNTTQIDPRYLYACVFNQAFTEYLIGREKGAAYPAVAPEDIGNAEIALPPLDEQRAIAHILGTLDDKIELNRRMNETLEATVRAMFKSWFVDFDPVRAKMSGEPPESICQRLGLTPDLLALFPDRLVDSVLGEMPEGWPEKRVDDVLELAYGKALKATDRLEGGVPVYGSGGITGFHNESLVDGPGIIIGRKGTVGSLYWEDRPFFPIDTAFFVIPKVQLTYCYYLLQTLELERMNTDAAVPGLNRNNVYRLTFAFPPSELRKEFDRLVKSLREKIFSNFLESETLVDLRDNLLPKLLSGELRVPVSGAV